MVFLGIFFFALISFAISELFGRQKHIGRVWSFVLTFTGFLIVGIIAIILSPSANKKPSKGHVAHLIVGILICLHAFLSIIMNSIHYKQKLEFINSMFYNEEFMFENIHVEFSIAISIAIGYLCLGLYLIVLSRGRIINRNPKVYFSLSDFSNNNPQPVKEKSHEHTQKATKNIEDVYYFARLEGKTTEALTLGELKKLRIKENTPVWRKGLDNWLFAKDLQELENIIVFEPPEFVEPQKVQKKDENQEVLPPEFVPEEPIVTPPPFKKENEEPTQIAPPPFKKK